MKGRGVEERLAVMWHPHDHQVVLVMGSLSRGTGFIPCNNICVRRTSCIC
jgi:hypothetical protein